ncbi:uncharacterized protein LOC143289300 [Babylonia areolata]|uniref:uncharacterized protein LOC143289300 n=1 Tax=Babylonia areolata TaxID=304850 RepID=UPI003FD10A40
MAGCLGRRVVLGLFLIFAVLHSSTFAGEAWSPWYNSDRDLSTGTQDETLDRIASMYQLPCGRERVVAVQCRKAGTNVTFSSQFRHEDNVLRVPCNLTGLLCKDHDQILSGTAPCADYELRLMCWIDDRDDDDTDEEEDDMGLAKGGFTAIVAGGAVVIPLACVLVFQLRKYRREEQRRQQNQQGALANGGQAGSCSTADPPPAYEELFGNSQSVLGNSQSAFGNSQPMFGNPRPVSVISSGVLQRGEGSVVGETETGAERSGGAERLLTSLAVRLEGRVNSLHAKSFCPCQSLKTQGLTYSTSVSSMSDDASERRASYASYSSSSSTDALMPPAVFSESSDAITHHHHSPSRRGPPPAYDWPGPGHVTVVMPSDGESSGGGVGRSSGTQTASTSFHPPPQPRPGRVMTTAQSPPPPPPPACSSSGRRFLGMHLSIFDLMSAIYPSDSAPAPSPTHTPPPPSYDDALKILEEASKHSQVQIT